MLSRIDIELIIDQIIFIVELLIAGQFATPSLTYLNELYKTLVTPFNLFKQDQLGYVIANMETLKKKTNQDYLKGFKKGSSRNLKIANQLQKSRKDYSQSFEQFMLNYYYFVWMNINLIKVES
ncbi:unnamed protein product [Paramecium sonneborni]|uniref:Uncharacterized protein n=1 Tax=Paramecium sonneborni TaxID=65129 RepID=A0A8S1K4V7_9CILI|nr:unnamed protein product [Paramecium sonneborni]